MQIPIEVRNLSKSYGGKRVVRSVSFNLHGGEILGLLGPNGAGKSTIVGMLYGAVQPDEGQVQIMGINALKEGKRARSFLGIVPQDNEVDRDFAVNEFLDSFAIYYGIPKKLREQKISEVLESFDLLAHREKNTENLSGGLKRRLMLARSLLNQPQIVFLDEPTTGLDPDARQEFWRYILMLKKRKAAVLLTTHYMDEAERLCDRLLLLKDGDIVAEGSPTELIQQFAGKEVIELHGVEEESVRSIALQYDTWFRPFGAGFMLGLAPDKREELLAVASHLVATRDTGNVSFACRATSLEDVFLIVTGTTLYD